MASSRRAVRCWEDVIPRGEGRLHEYERSGELFAEINQAPTSGRLAAAIATNRAISRLIRRGVERNNEATRCMTKILPCRRKNRP
jgi:hypothetical protein